MQEYCTKTTSKEASQALWKKLGNWLTFKKNRTLGTRYLPLEKSKEGPKCSESVMNVLDDNPFVVTEVTVCDPAVITEGNQPEIISVVGHLMKEKGKLEMELEQVIRLKIKIIPTEMI